MLERNPAAHHRVHELDAMGADRVWARHRVEFMDGERTG
jgi:hypothetical protein